MAIPEPALPLTSNNEALLLHPEIDCAVTAYTPYTERRGRILSQSVQSMVLSKVLTCKVCQKSHRPTWLHCLTS